MVVLERWLYWRGGCIGEVVVLVRQSCVVSVIGGIMALLHFRLNLYMSNNYPVSVDNSHSFM